MKSKIRICDLCFADRQQKQLTLHAQELLKERLLSQAKDRAVHDDLPVDLSHKVYEYYYDELACFMQEYPNVLIDLVLIKLEESSLSKNNSEALLTL
jgi:hypothetical protein